MKTEFIKPRLLNADKPKDGVLQVRQENGEVLPAAGRTVTLTPYWRRRLRDGDVVRAKPAKGKAPANADKSEE